MCLVMAEAVQEFVLLPTAKGLQGLNKAELLEVAKKLNLTDVSSRLTKVKIAELIAQHYQEEDVFTSEDVFASQDSAQFADGEPQSPKPSSDIELKIQLMQFKREMEREREQADEREKVRQFELEKLRLELDSEEKERERQERLKNARLKLERQKLETQIELAKLGEADPWGNTFCASREVRFVPPFNELEVNKYFQHFEKVADGLEWPKEYWPVMLQSVIKGKAQQAYSALGLEDASIYDVVKQAILTAYELVPEASPIALVKSVTEMPMGIGSSESTCPYDAKKAEMSDLLREEFLPLVSEGFVSLSENSTPRPIRILRDIGTSRSLLLKEALSSCESEDTKVVGFTPVQGIEERIVTVPLHSVFLKSDLVTGQVKVGLMSSFPIEGISLLLRNEKAKAEEDSVQSSTLLQSDRDLSGGKSSESSCFDDLSDTFLIPVFKQDLGSLPLEVGEYSHVCDDLFLSGEQLIGERGSDPEIAEVSKEALPDDEIVKVPVGCYQKDGVWLQKWRPPDIPARRVMLLSILLLILLAMIRALQKYYVFLYKGQEQMVVYIL